MRYNWVLFLLLLIHAQDVSGQKRDGYIINLDGDTVKGSIYYATFFNSKHSKPHGLIDMRFQVSVGFKDSNGNKVTYKPGEIKGFGYYYYGQASFFESLFLSDTNKAGIPANGKYFVCRMETGNINIYKFNLGGVFCNNIPGTPRYVYLIKKKEANEIKYLKGVCDSFLDYRKITDYLGNEHPVSKYIINENNSGKTVYLQQLFLRIHQYNTGNIEVAGTNQKTTKYCDTCYCNVYLVKRKKRELVERKWMGTYAPGGFYLYEGFLYNLKFKDKKLFRGVLVKVMGDTMIVTNNFNKRVADKDHRSYDTLALPVASLEKIHLQPNLVGFMGDNLNMSAYTIEAKKVKGSPVAEFSIFYYGVLRNVRCYFAGDNVYYVYEHDGSIYGLE